MRRDGVSQLREVNSAASRDPPRRQLTQAGREELTLIVSSHSKLIQQRRRSSDEATLSSDKYEDKYEDKGRSAPDSSSQSSQAVSTPLSMPTRALLLVDIQYDFLQGGALAVPHGEQILTTAYRLLESSAFSLVVASQVRLLLCQTAPELSSQAAVPLLFPLRLSPDAPPTSPLAGLPPSFAHLLRFAPLTLTLHQALPPDRRHARSLARPLRRRNPRLRARGGRGDATAEAGEQGAGRAEGDFAGKMEGRGADARCRGLRGRRMRILPSRERLEREGSLGC